MSEQKLTTASGIPYYHNEDTKSAGPRGPLLLEDFILHEKMAHFNRERIPERVVHAKGSGAFGTFKVTHDISQYTRAKVFNQIGKETRVFLRFSTVGGEKGSADTERDPRGFAVKFYTEDGNWDLVGNNTPIFFIKDPKKFSDFIHTQKRDPFTNCKSPTMMWDFWSLNPESLHQVMFLFSDRGTPKGYRFMHGFGSHTFSFINAKNEKHWVKFHFKSLQGIQNFTNDEATTMKGTVRGELKLGIIPTLAPYLLPLFITAFTQKYSQVKLTVIELTTELMIVKLKDGSIDAGLLVTPLNEQGLKEDVLFYEELIAYVSKTNAAFRKNYVLAKDIDPNKLWLLEEGHCFRSQIINLCELRKESAEGKLFEYEAGSVETLRRMVELNDGVTILPELATLDLPAKQMQLLRHFKNPAPVREVSLVVHRQFVKKRLVDALKQVILAAVPEKVKKNKKSYVVEV